MQAALKAPLRVAQSTRLAQHHSHVVEGLCHLRVGRAVAVLPNIQRFFAERERFRVVPLAEEQGAQVVQTHRHQGMLAAVRGHPGINDSSKASKYITSWSRPDDGLIQGARLGRVRIE